MPLKFLWLLALLFSAGFTSKATAETCTVISSTCTQGPETRVINAEPIYRDCWQWQEKRECVSGETVDHCTTLESNAACAQVATECLEMGTTECQSSQKTYECTQVLDSLAEGVSALEPKVTVIDHWAESTACADLDDCSIVSEVCSMPNQTMTIEGFEVTVDCAQKVRTASCLVTPENPSCGVLEAAFCSLETETDPAAPIYRCEAGHDFSETADLTLLETVTVLDAITVTSDTCAALTSCNLANTKCELTDADFPDICLTEHQTRLCEATVDDAACNPLLSAGCTEQEPAISTTASHYLCTTEVATSPAITEVDRVTTYSDAQSFNTCPAQLPLAQTRARVASSGDCFISERTCVEAGDTRVIDGVEVTQDCWRWEVTYSCTGDVVSNCDELESDTTCTLQKSECLAMGTNGCELMEHVYACVEREAQTKTQEVCTDTVCQAGVCTSRSEAPSKGLTNAVTKLEVARQAAVYGDYKNLRFFNGEANRCRNKSGGVSCCRGKVSTNTTNKNAVGLAMTFATDVAGEAVHTMGSHFVHDILSNHSELAEVWTKLYGNASWATFSPSLSYYGMSVSMGANGITFDFNPTMFFAMVALDVATDYMACEPEEQALQLKRGANLCHYIGSRCTQYFMGHCLIKTQSYCCFNSALALLVQEAAHDQLGLSWGTAAAPVCTGLTARQMNLIDFSVIETEEVMMALGLEASVPDAQKTATRAATRIDTLENATDPYEKLPGHDGTVSLTH